MSHFTLVHSLSLTSVTPPRLQGLAGWELTTRLLYCSFRCSRAVKHTPFQVARSSALILSPPPLLLHQVRTNPALLLLSPGPALPAVIYKKRCCSKWHHYITGHLAAHPVQLKARPSPTGFGTAHVQFQSWPAAI